MAASKKAKPLTKTAFVLRLPLGMSPKEVVAKAKDAGIDLTENYVSNIRSSAKAKKKAKRAASKASPAKKTVASKTSKAKAVPAPAAAAPTATDFIASQPRDIPAAAVVKAAKKAGLKINAGYVYKVRSRLAAKGAKSPAPKAVAPKLEGAPKAPPIKTGSATLTSAKPAAKGAASNIEGSFKRLVVELGVARATELVGEVKRTLAELFGAS